MSKCERQKSNWSEIISTFFNFLLLVTAVAGVLFVRVELKEITKQNEYTGQSLELLKEQNEYVERSFKQSYRPVGVINWGEKSTSYSPTRNENGTITISCQKRILNNGKGILLFIGYLKFLVGMKLIFIQNL